MTSQHDKPKRWQLGLTQMVRAGFVLAVILGGGVALYPVFDGHSVIALAEKCGKSTHIAASKR